MARGLDVRFSLAAAGLLLCACRSSLVAEPGAADLAQPDLVAAPHCGDVTGLQPGAPWPMRGYCPTHRGRSSAPGAAAGTFGWSVMTGDNVTSSPAIGAGAAVYAGSLDGQLYAVDGASGRPRWTFATARKASLSEVLVSGVRRLGSIRLSGASPARSCST